VPCVELAIGVEITAPDRRDQLGISRAVDVRQRDTHTYSNGRVVDL
jgi:hypothetical protein